MISIGNATAQALGVNGVAVGSAFLEQSLSEESAVVDSGFNENVFDENMVVIDSVFTENNIEELYRASLSLIDVDYLGVGNKYTATETFTNDTNIDLVSGVSPSTFSSYGVSGGSGNRTSSITVSSTGLTWYPGGYIPQNTVNGSFVDGPTTSTYIASPTTIDSSKNIVFDFGVGNAKAIVQMLFYFSGAFSVGNWKIQGGNNGVDDWVDLTPAITFGGATTVTLALTNQVSNPIAYRYYRFLGDSGTFAQGHWREVEFKIVDPTVRAFTSVDSATEAFPFSYANSRSIGNRSSLITITSENLSTTYSVQTLVNGDYVPGAGSFYFTTPQTLDSTRRIHFDFQVPVTITGFKWYQNTTTSQGVWDLQGSVDNNAWVTVAPSITLASATTTTHVISSPGNYRYYRLAGVSGSTNNTTWNTEIEFELAEVGFASKILQSNVVITRNSKSAKIAFSLIGPLSNVTAFISKDNGTTWESTVLTDTGRTTTINGFVWKTIESNVVDMTPQTGTQFKYRIVVGAASVSHVRSVALLASGLEE